ncbi:hypothetical protein [Turicibacter sp. TJ11]|uniref:hypothetical protein n=1 Tax=Turicibacter sp. TJ11 TaxID=2806443 RepID=UPI001F44F2E2|nr:hypothetical protein [Turicibacter sp. TJ11]
MLNVITNIILSMMLTLSSDVSVTLEKNNMTQQSYTHLLNAIIENEKQNSFLNKEFNSESISVSVQEEQTSDNELSASYLDKVETSVDDLVSEVSTQKIVALKNLQTAITQKNELEQIDLVSSTLKKSSDEELEVTTVSTTVSTDSDESTDVMSDVVEETEEVFRDYRQTFYSVTSGEVKVGYGITYQDDDVMVIDNVMHYYDDEYEWLPIVAVNIDEVLAVGLNERGIPNYYGTILEITYPEGETQKAIVLDACGACSWDNRIDLWVYDQDYQHDIKGIEYRIVREGFRENEEQSGY